MEVTTESGALNALTCELEDWFHILDSKRAPRMEEWCKLPLCAERNVEKLLQLFCDTGVRATFFCLGWMAERMPHLVRRCHEAGHEIGSHGYGHVMADRVSKACFREDIVRSKHVLEDITGRRVMGFRSPGFSVGSDSRWFFDVVAEAGHTYDASVFPAYHGHGGLRIADPGPQVIETAHGPLIEIPESTVTILRQRVCLFGGGYLRIAPLPLIRWGIRRLHRARQPLVVYLHPREIEPDHPRVPLGPWRRFKCYVNLRSTMPKLRWLCEHYPFTTMNHLAETFRKRAAQRSSEPPSAGQVGRLPVVTLGTGGKVARSTEQSRSD